MTFTSFTKLNVLCNNHDEDTIIMFEKEHKILTENYKTFVVENTYECSLCKKKFSIRLEIPKIK